ncbi:HAD family hydrolase [Alkalihalobacillus sp. BA299]|uniref:HAD family hydrolase n=1 Tax=Alkalihalobacillus sp. BA299 TaxID=2815938 RepID=UPI001ADC50CC|nr:HAD-IIIA family hydrolase [Alkalihalobacillus sp. BA299]
MTEFKKTTILFDLDGTLFDSKNCLVHAAYETTKRFDPKRDYLELLEQNFGVVYGEILSAINPALATEIIACYKEIKMKSYPEQVQPFPFVKEGLNSLSQKGFKLAIVTNQGRKITEEILKQFQLDQYFDVIVAHEDVKNHKPAPDALEKALSFLNTKPENAIMVGDSRFDILAAEKAGIESVLINLYGTLEQSNCKPNYLFNTIQDFFTNFKIEAASSTIAK